MKIKDRFDFEQRLQVNKLLAELRHGGFEQVVSAEEAFEAALDGLLLLKNVLQQRHWVFGPTNSEVIVGDSVNASDMMKSDFSFIEGSTRRLPNAQRDPNGTLTGFIQDLIRQLNLLGDRYVTVEYSFPKETEFLLQLRAELEAGGKALTKLVWTNKDRLELHLKDALEQISPSTLKWAQTNDSKSFPLGRPSQTEKTMARENLANTRLRTTLKRLNRMKGKKRNPQKRR